jgi:mxaL protein
MIAQWRHSPKEWWRLGLLVAALLCLLSTFTLPRIELQSDRYRAVLVVDITRSMNVRDYPLDGRAASRLDVVKTGIHSLLLNSACRSELGLAIFASRRAFLLFEPLEVCDNFAPITAAIEALNWRMAWQGDSGIAYGLNSAFDLARSMNADLIFVTDGQEAPPPPRRGPPRFRGESGQVAGLILGVGGYRPAPIPKYDRDGQEIGLLDATDVPHESRLGPPPEEARNRPGWHPRNAPWGGRMRTGSEHLSSVHEGYLRQRSELMRLDYVHLDDAGALTSIAHNHLTPRPVTMSRDLRWLPASLALICLAGVYLVPLLPQSTTRITATGEINAFNI